MIKTLTSFLTAITLTSIANAATIIATVNEKPITDTDITARVKLMNRQGQTSIDNRQKAFENIINDFVKIDYGMGINISVSDKEIDSELKKMDLSDLSSTEKEMAKIAIKSNLTWQQVIGRTIMPTTQISDQDISDEKASLIAERGLPIETTIIRLIDIPSSVANKLKKPKSCDDAMEMARDLGGQPQRITAMQYELSDDVRSIISTLPQMQWSDMQEDSVLLVCDSKKSDDYGDLDNIIKQNAVFKKAISAADQHLKQLRRKAIIIINDKKYKL